jgi:hypothetical protein
VLSILCVTKPSERAQPFIVNMSILADRLDAEFILAVDGVDVHSKGYIESVLDDAIALTHGDYILRLDDDERCSPAMVRWLEAREYETGDHFTFPRVHFWGDSSSVIVEEHYFPDFQTRLSVRAKAGGRNQIHMGSPYGAGEITRVCLEHWVYLAKSYEERCATGVRYNQIRAGADGGVFRSSSIEDEHPEGLRLIDYNDGSVPLRGAGRHTGPLR